MRFTRYQTNVTYVLLILGASYYINDLRKTEKKQTIEDYIQNYE